MEVIIGPIIWILVIVDMIYTFRKIRSTIKNEYKDVPILVKCGKCNNKHEISIDGWMSKLFTKSIRTSKTKLVGIATVKKTNFEYLAKKIYCPVCDKNTWHEMESFNEFGDKNLKIVLPYALKLFARVIVIMSICQIILLWN